MAKKVKSKKNYWIVIVSVFVLIIGIIGVKIATSEVYRLKLPVSDEIDSIVFEMESGSVAISERDEIEDIIEELNELQLSTKNVSVQDYPTDVENIVAIRFNYREDRTYSIYIYIRNNRYYLEEAYNGIYKLERDDYNDILELIEE